MEFIGKGKFCSLLIQEESGARIIRLEWVYAPVVEDWYLSANRRVAKPIEMGSTRKNGI